MIAASIFESPLFVPSLAGAILILQLVMLSMLASLSGKVARLSRREAAAAPAAQPAGEVAEVKEANSEQKQLFAVFLEEEPSRRELSKKEQFAAFRRWRDEKGLNWKKPADSA